MLLLLAPLAAAYTLSGEALSDAQLPLVIHWTGTQPGFTPEELGAAIEGAAAAWEEAAACGLDIQVVEDPLADEWFQDGGVSVLFGDPDAALGDGVLALTFTGAASGETFERNGVTFTEASPTEIVFNDLPVWVTDAAIVAGDCADQLSLQAALTHELGHVLGLGDSCAEGEACTDAAAMDATMYWALPLCDESKSTPGSDDMAGLAAIYGEPYDFGFTCEAADDALTVTCTVTGAADAGSLSPTWAFGDGATGAGDPVTHTFASSGVYPVELCIFPPDCGGQRCTTASVRVDSGRSDTGSVAGPDQAPPDDSPTCGCVSAPGAAPWLGALFAALSLRRRR